MKSREIEKIRKLIGSEICEVVGCTEPAGIAYAFSQATDIIRGKYKIIDNNKIKAKVTLFHDVHRNASTVRVPVIMKKDIKAAISYGIYSNGNSLNTFSNARYKKKIFSD